MYGFSSADFNDDRLLDFCHSTLYYSTVTLFLNMDNLLFEQRHLFSFNYSYVKDLETGDIDGDGFDDFVSGGSVGIVRLFKNNNQNI
jgi:hypothetical protein